MRLRNSWYIREHHSKITWSLIMNLDDGSWKLYIIFIFRVIKSDSGNKEENHGPSNEILVDPRLRFLIAIRTSSRLAVGVPWRAHWRGSTPLNTRLSSHPSKRDQRYYLTIIRFATHHIRDHANTEREVIAVPWHRYPNVAKLCEFIRELYRKESQRDIFSFYSNLLISLDRTFVLINL